jgi:glycosyltransferase involved in cell wall biosynthesis
MNIAFFFTYGYSLKIWEDTGTLYRELKILEVLSKKYNFKFTLFTYGDLDDLNVQLNKKVFTVIPIYTIVKKSKFNLINLFSTLILPFRIKRKLKDIDLIHQHQLQGSWVTIIIKYIYKIPLVIRTGYDVYTFSKKENKNKIVIYLYKALTYFALSRSNLYTVTSVADYEFLKKTFKTAFKNVQIRPNYVDLNSFKPFSERLQRKVLTVGRLEKQKNYELLISEFSKTENKYELDIVGKGSLEDYLKEISKKNNGSVNFLGNFENKELTNLYTNYKYFISTSTFEGNPKTILEAMSSGCIVIASAINNHLELIEDGKTGFLFNLEDPNIFEIISNLEKNKEKSEEVAKNAIEHVIKVNSLDGLAFNTSEDYLEILNSR